MDSRSTEAVEAEQPLRIFTWRGFGFAWDGEEKPVETRQIVAAVSQQRAMSIAAEWTIYSYMVETFPPESVDPEHVAVALRKPGAIFWTSSGSPEWQELTKETQRLPPSARAPLQPVIIPRVEDVDDMALFRQVRIALEVGQGAVEGLGKLPFMDGLIAVAGLEERMRQARGRAHVEQVGERKDWIQTFSLRKFHPLNPDPTQVWLLDIAHALAMQCRYTGHVHHFYSVAEHSVRVSLLAELLELTRNGGDRRAAREVAKIALLHDASEAYLIDVARPVKRSATMQGYRDAETRLQSVILTVFGLPTEEPAVVKEADKILGATEARDLFPGVHPDWQWIAKPMDDRIVPFNHSEAEAMFLGRFQELGPWPESTAIPTGAANE